MLGHALQQSSWCRVFQIAAALIVCNSIYVSWTTGRILLAVHPLADTQSVATTASTTNNEKSVCSAHSVLARWKSDAKHIAAAFQPEDVPTKQRPFFYFHLRKAGGSTLRTLIGQAAESHDLTHWTPCVGRPCMPFSIPPGTELYQVYASHLEYHTAMTMLREVDFHATVSGNLQHVQIQRTPPTTNNDNESDQKQQASTIDVHQFVGDPPHTCMTRLRPTVDRVASCWNFRGVQNAPTADNPPAHEIHVNDWLPLLNSIDCSNEIVRMFGSMADLSYVRTASPCDPVAEVEFEVILRRMSTCVMTHNDRCEESKEIVDAFLPWLSDKFVCKAKENVGKVNKQPLSKGASAVILKANEYDDLLYQFGEALFEAQLERARELRKDTPV